jgi:hypothetical protein
MKQFSKIFFIVALCLNIFSGDVLAANGNSNATGYWNNPSTWLFAGNPAVPTCGDTMDILSGYTVTVNQQNNYTGCGAPMIIYVHGILEFTNGNKLSLPCGSYVYILPGGIVRKATAGGGNSTFIEICGIAYWTAADGPISGPDTLGPTSLPISLLSFDAQPAENRVDVTWTTASETNNDYFTVEKSVDGIDFVSIATVDGAGNSTVTLNYSYADFNPVHGISYYRLKQTDFDGQFSYSPVIMVSYLSSAPLNVTAAFVIENSNLNLLFTDDAREKCTMEIYDVLGKNIFQSTVDANKGLNKKQIQIPELLSGIYFVTLKNNRTSVSRRFVKE